MLVAGQGWRQDLCRALRGGVHDDMLIWFDHDLCSWKRSVFGVEQGEAGVDNFIVLYSALPPPTAEILLSSSNRGGVTTH